MHCRFIFPIPAITRDPAYEQALGLHRSEIMRKITDMLVAELTNSTDEARGQEQNTRPPHHPKMKILRHLE